MKLENQSLVGKMEESGIISRDLESTLTEKIKVLSDNFREQLANKDLEVWKRRKEEGGEEGGGRREEEKGRKYRIENFSYIFIRSLFSEPVRLKVILKIHLKRLKNVLNHIRSFKIQCFVWRRKRTT